MENQTSPPGKSRIRKIIIFLVFLIIIFLTAFLFWRLFEKTNNETAITGDISPQIVDIDKEREVSRVVTSAGAALSTQAADGTLYSLTIPPGSVLMPKTVTLTPLKDTAVKNFKTSQGFGVYIGPPGSQGMTFIRPAYLVIKPNTPVPPKTQNGPAEWGRCSIGSVGFHPEMCAAQKALRFGIGIEPGKAVIYSKTNENKKLESLYLTPTTPIGEEDVYVASVWSTGSYMSARLSGADLKSFSPSTFDKASDYVNKAELLAHLAALGENLEPYNYEISRMAREKKDYPREVMKTAIFATKAGLDDVAKKRMEDLKTVVERNLSKTRGSFMPWPYYVGFLEQLEAGKNDQSGELEKITARLTGQINPAEIIKSARIRCDEVLNNKNAFGEEKGDAMEVIDQTDNTAYGTTSSYLSPAGEGGAGGGASGAGNWAAYCNINAQEQTSCNTVADCERLIWLSNRWKCPHDGVPGKKRIDELRGKMENCADLWVKKDLKTYGMNDCDMIGKVNPEDYLPVPGNSDSKK